MNPEALFSIATVLILSFIVSIIVTFVMRKIHRNMVFVFPILLSLFTGSMAMTIFSGEAGWGAIFLIGIVLMAGIATLVSWAVALISFFKHRP